MVLEAKKGGSMRAWQVSELGDVSKMKLVDLPKPELKPGTNLIKVEASAINFYDSLMIKGTYQFKPTLPFVPGNEVAGVIEEAGSGSKFKTGDKVISRTAIGGYAEYILARDEGPFVIPDSMPFSDAAALQVNYGTAHFALHRRAHLQKGETLLVLAAAGGVGSAAIHLGKAAGAKVIAVAGSQEKLDVCTKEGADETINYNEEGWQSKVKDYTDGKGANVIYDPVGGDAFDKALKNIAWEGRVVLIGFTSGNIQQIAANRVLLKNISIIGLQWGAYEARGHRALMDEATIEVLEMYDKGEFKPLIYDKYPLADAQKALAEVSTRKTYGKLILTMS